MTKRALSKVLVKIRSKKAHLGLVGIAVMAAALISGPILQTPVNADHHTNTTIKWTTHAPEGNGDWQTVTWSPQLGKFVAIANRSPFPAPGIALVLTSTDGKDWQVGAASDTGAWRSVAWSPEQNLFVAVACSNVIGNCGLNSSTDIVMTSPDGITWTTRSASEDSTWQSVVWSPEVGLFVAVADDAEVGSDRVMTSPDGINWTARTAAEANAWRSVTWSPEQDLFVAVASSGTDRVMTSPDGINWTARTAAEANSWEAVTWSPDLSKFVAVAQDGTNRTMISSDGITWTAHAAPGSKAWTSVTWSPELGRFMAVANSGTNRVMTSLDGETWTDTDTPVSADSNWNSITWSPELGAFAAVAEGGSNAERVMTGSMITAGTNEATSVTQDAATLNGDYQDSFAGADVFFRYRIAGSGGSFTETTAQAVTTQGPFSADIDTLDPDTTYEFKAVVQWPSVDGTQTLEGGLRTFTTLPPDDDNDGVPNTIEDAGPNGGDANNDGTPDSTQGYVASFVNTITNKYAVLEVDATCQIDTVSMTAESGNAAQDQGFEYPAGLMDFTADCGTPGFTTTVTQYQYGTEADYVLRKYDPNENTYFTIDDVSFEHPSIGGEALTKASFEITDGGELDTDGDANGTVVDPAGLALSSDGELADTGQNAWAYMLLAVSLILVGMGVVFRNKMVRIIK